MTDQKVWEPNESLELLTPEINLRGQKVTVKLSPDGSGHVLLLGDRPLATSRVFEDLPIWAFGRGARMVERRRQ